MGHFRGGYATKIHILCSGKGNPLKALLSPSQDHESKHLAAVMSSIPLTGSEHGEPIIPAKIAGDKSYRSQWIDEWLLGQPITPVIPSKENEDRACRAVEFDKVSYRRRCIMIGWIRECRRLATRYEKLARNYLFMVKLSMIGRFLRLIATWDSVV